MQKIIVFDMDGVLFDSTHFAQEEMCRLYPGLTSEIMKEMNCGNWHEEVKKLTIPRIEETKEEVEQGRVAYAEKKSNAPIFDGVVNLLDKFHKAGYKIILNTSVSARNCLPLLEKNNIIHFFDLLGTKELSESKIEKFKMIQEKYNIQKENLIFVKDTLGDIREADIAGVSTIAVTWGAHDEAYFTKESHGNLLKIVDSMEHLESTIEEYFQ